MGKRKSPHGPLGDLLMSHAEYQDWASNMSELQPFEWDNLAIQFNFESQTEKDTQVQNDTSENNGNAPCSATACQFFESSRCVARAGYD